MCGQRFRFQKSFIGPDARVIPMQIVISRVAGPFLRQPENGGDFLSSSHADACASEGKRPE
jgi:hypothetical protein